MKFLRALLLAAAALAFSAPAFAASQSLCAPDAAAGATGARRVVNPTTNAAYSLNSNGCGIFAQADIGYFLTQGFSPGPDHNTIIFTTGALPASGTTDIPLTVPVPAGTYIQMLIWQNTTANAVTGGMSLGTTANGTDVVAAQALAANALVFTTDALLLKRVFSATAGTTLHMAPVTSSNTSNITLTIVYGYF